MIFFKFLIKLIFIYVGSGVAKLWPIYQSRLLLFFPGYKVGGAEIIHLKLVCLFAKERPIIFFTDTKGSKNLLIKFSVCGKVVHLDTMYKIPGLRYFFQGYIATLVNSSKTPKTLLGSNSGFFYELLPLLNDRHQIVDITHAFGGIFENFSLRYVGLIDKRIVVSHHLIDEFRCLYKRNSIDEKYLKRIKVIENCVSLPEISPISVDKEKLRILYVGRGSTEKRIHIIGSVARSCVQNNVKATFTVLGDSRRFVFDADLPLITFPGEVLYPDKFYQSSDILLLTSSREGFPVVLIEALFHGLIPICVSVGGISTHIGSEVGILIPNYANEDEIIRAIYSEIKNIASKSPEEILNLKKLSRRYAFKKFSEDKFDSEYLSLLN